MFILENIFVPLFVFCSSLEPYSLIISTAHLQQRIKITKWHKSQLSGSGINMFLVRQETQINEDVLLKMADLFWQQHFEKKGAITASFEVFSVYVWKKALTTALIFSGKFHFRFQVSGWQQTLRSRIYGAWYRPILRIQTCRRTAKFHFCLCDKIFFHWQT